MSKILLVEDDNNLREIYEARLQAEGYTIISARDGEEALVFAKNEKPDLVISDVMMPKISGFEMLDILRNTEGLKQVKVIMLTALGQSDDQQRASRLGADHYLVKSQVTLEDIVKVAHELLQDEPTPPPALEVPAQPVAPAPAAVPVPTPVPQPVAAPVVPAPAPQITPQPTVQPVVPQPSPAINVSSPVTAPPIVATPTPPPALEVPAQPVAPAPAAVPVPTPVPQPVAAPVVPAPAPQITPQPTVQPVVPQPSPAINVSSPVTAPPIVATPTPPPALEVPAQPVAPAPAAVPVPTPVPQPVAAPVEANVTLPEAKPENESNPSISVASIFANATNMNLDSKPVKDTSEPVKSDPEHIESEAKATEESVAQSTAEEEASVEAKIEDFVTGASSNPDKPVVNIPSATSSENEETNVDGSSSNDEITKNDDKLMQNAVNTLITESEPKPPSSPITIAPSTSSTYETAPPPENTSTPIDTLPGPTSSQKQDNVTIAHKKIIAPVGAEPKQDLDTLLAIEAAKENGPAQPMSNIVSEAARTESETNPQSGSVIAPPPSVPPPLPLIDSTPPPANTGSSNDGERVDPNSIAL